MALNVPRATTALLLLLLATAGAYGTFGLGYQSGLFAALTEAAVASLNNKRKKIWFPGGPRPYKTVYTGVEAVDGQLCVLIAFFTLLLDVPDGGGDGNNKVVFGWLMMQFLVGWGVLVVEGLRRGNRGRVVSWTGTLGVIFQNITYTVSVPIYLVIHLFTSPISNPSSGGAQTQDEAAAALAVDTQDLFLLPFSMTTSFTVPAVMMSLPCPAMVSASAHYTWQALWQIFPLAQTVSHQVAKHLTAPLHFQPSSPRRHDDLYRVLAALAFIPQTTLLALTTITTTALSPLVGVQQQLSFTSTFVPPLTFSAATAVVKKPEVMAVAARAFLQWDMYCGGLAVLVWAVYVTQVARQRRTWTVGEVGGLVVKVLGWTVLGGPVGAAVMLLWERDGRAVVKEAVPAVESSTMKG